MSGVRTDRLWLVGGAITAVVLLVIAWFVFINPRNSENSGLREQGRAAEARVGQLAKRLAELRQQNAELPRYMAQLERDRQALPTSSGLSDFLRSLQAAGDAAGVSVGGLAVGTANQVAAAGTQIHALPLTVTASGRAGNLSQFVDQLQHVQPRAVLINSANMTGDQAAKSGDTFNLMLSLQVFVAPPVAAQPSETPGTK
jgi:type IV pilus assembly protein PilO